MRASERRHLRRLLERRRCPHCRATAGHGPDFQEISRRTVLCGACGWYGTIDMMTPTREEVGRK